MLQGPQGPLEAILLEDLRSRHRQKSRQLRALRLGCVLQASPARGEGEIPEGLGVLSHFL